MISLVIYLVVILLGFLLSRAGGSTIKEGGAKGILGWVVLLAGLALMAWAGYQIFDGFQGKR